MSMMIRNKHFQVAFCRQPDCAWRRKLFVWKGGELRIWRGGMAGEGNMLRTRSRLPEKVVLSVATILESARPFVEFQGFTRQRQKCCWKFAKSRYNG
ncbi:hypothetical protein A7P96_08265 [Eikenella sp. NML03-A-027]|nr:hypothetical protein A7P96_08265 [Eikenella sp. NML03-A-027]